MVNNDYQSTNHSKTACFGDSITAGVPGISYLRNIQNKKKYINYGIGGDTLLGLSKRIDIFLSKSTCSDFIIEIGANDILSPFLSSYSKSWDKMIKSRIARGSVPLTNSCDFKMEYEKLICKLSNKQLKVISIPCLGEMIESNLNSMVDEYNSAIKNLCEKYNIRYIDFNAWQKEIINRNDFASNYFISKNPLDLMLDGLTTTYLGCSSLISKKRMLTVTVDGVHLNEIGAKGLASLIEKSGL